MSTRRLKVLFLCAGNSARSIIAESIMLKLAGDRFEPMSAGSKPKAEPNPNALKTLMALNFPVAQARSKSWDLYLGADAPALDFIFTLCDQEAGEVCDVPAGRAITGHWNLTDPAAVTGEAWEIDRAFNDTFRMLRRRIEAFSALPIDALDRASLQHRVDDIARIDDTRA